MTVGMSPIENGFGTLMATASEQPVLFLDIDGVLLAGRHWRDGQVKNTTWIPPDTVAILNRICDEAGCLVVLSSSWRRDENCRDHLLLAGFCGEFHQDWRTEHSRAELHSRGAEILAWLLDHSEIESYGILDDDIDMLPNQMRRFVQVDGEIGLTDADANRLISMLRRLTP